MKAESGTVTPVAPHYVKNVALTCYIGPVNIRLSYDLLVVKVSISVFVHIAET